MGSIVLGLFQVLTYKERADLCTHPVTRQLFSIMSEKETNLAFSADVTSSQELLQVSNFSQ